MCQDPDPDPGQKSGSGSGPDPRVFLPDPTFQLNVVKLEEFVFFN